jgi:hypothetical protein
MIWLGVRALRHAYVFLTMYRKARQGVSDLSDTFAVKAGIQSRCLAVTVRTRAERP